MKKIIFISIVLFTFCNVFAQGNTSQNVKGISNAAENQQQTEIAVQTDTPAKLVQKQLEAYNSKNLDTFMEFFSDDAEIIDFYSKMPNLKGKKNIRAVIGNAFNQTSNLYYEVVNRITLGNTVIDSQIITGIPNSKPQELIAIYKIKNNKVSKLYLMPKEDIVPRNATSAKSPESSIERNDKAFVAEFDSYLSSKLPANEPGGAFLVMINGKIIFSKGYGLADMKTKEKITPKTVFNLGSISKTFVANAILKLSEEGKLSLEDSLDKYFKDFKNPEIAKKVKIIHLLTHTSGLIDSRKYNEEPDFYLTAKDKENFEPIKQNDKLSFEPGEKFAYSNPAYNGLALIVEKVSGMKWQDYIKKNIFIPSKMYTSTITDGPEPSKNVAHAYTFNEKNKKWDELDYGETLAFAASGNGGIWSSVLELVNYEMALQNNVFLSKEMFEKSRKVYRPKNWLDDSKEPFVGYSWFVGDEFNAFDDNYVNDEELVGHAGAQGGFYAFHNVIPKQEVFYVGILNRNLEGTKMFTEFNNIGFRLMKKHGILK